MNAGIGAEHSPTSTAAQARADYTGNRGGIGLLHEETRGANLPGSHHTSLRLRTALVAARGHFGLSQPVSDSFALVAPDKKLSDQVVPLNPRGEDRADAYANSFGPGVVSNLLSYHYYRLQLDSSLLKPGYLLDRENYTLLPSYKSAILILPGNESSVMLSGFLEDESGTPLALQSGEARLTGRSGVSEGAEPASLPVTLFTNRKGRFRMEGLQPGTYELTLFDEGYAPIVFSIPDGAEGIFEIGRLRVKKK